MFEFILFILALVVSIPLLIVGSECLISLFNPAFAASAVNNIADTKATYKILIPAHNEATIIHNTLSKLISQLPDSKPENILVIADNCTDDTAKIARSLNVSVLERHNDNLKGKGFALDFGIQHLLSNHATFDVLTIIDADCSTDKTSLSSLIEQVKMTGLPGQMVNIMRSVDNNNIKQKIAVFAWLLKNKIRPLALHLLKLPVPLTGTGMAFPRHLLTHIQLGSANIVEDTQLGIDCSIKGFMPQFCPHATIYSTFPTQASAELSQRTRWEHGHLQTIIQQTPRLIKEASKQKNWKLLALAMDISVPPLSLQVLMTLSSLGILLLLRGLTGYPFAFNLLALSFLYFTAMLMLIWWHYGRDLLTLGEICSIPRYILAKISIYSGFINKRQKDWVRTERDS